MLTKVWVVLVAGLVGVHGSGRHWKVIGQNPNPGTSQNGPGNSENNDNYGGNSAEAEAPRDISSERSAGISPPSQQRPTPTLGNILPGGNLGNTGSGRLDLGKSYGNTGSHVGAPGNSATADKQPMISGRLGDMGMGGPFGGMGNPFGGMGNPFGGMGNLFGGMGNPFGGMGNPFGGMGNPFGGMGNPFGGMGNMFGGMGNPFGGIGNLFGGLGMSGQPKGKDMGRSSGGINIGNLLGGMGQGNPVGGLNIRKPPSGGNPFGRTDGTGAGGNSIDIGKLLNNMMSGGPFGGLLSSRQGSPKSSSRPVSLIDLLSEHGILPSMGGQFGRPNPNSHPKKESKEDISRGIDSILGSIFSPMASHRHPSTVARNTDSQTNPTTTTAPTNPSQVSPTRAGRTSRPARAHTMQGALGDMLKRLQEWKTSGKTQGKEVSSAHVGTGKRVGTFKSSKSSMSYDGKSYRQTGKVREGFFRKESDNGLNLEPDFQMEWDITHNGNKWWKGKHVCDRKEVEDKEVAEGDIAQQTLQCSDDVHSFGCVKITQEGRKQKVLKHVYECCDGWIRQKGDDGCPRQIENTPQHNDTY